MITTRIKERLFRREPIFSFEFFPPKTEKGERSLRRALERLVPLNPAFVSVTYGAGGSTREKTREIVCSIQEDYGLTVMAHVTCVGHTNDEIRDLLQTYNSAGITNILALRGDPPRGNTDWNLVMDGPKHAVDVIRIAKECGWFDIGCAGFPEVHPESPHIDTDIGYLKEKVDAGADFIITQLFFDNEAYFHFVHHARQAGIYVPILPGVMPVTKAGQIERFHEMSGCVIPETLMQHIQDCGDDEQRIQEIGLAYCAGQCVDLLRRGAPGIHLYTLNQSRACHTIYAALSSMGLWS